MASRSMMFIGLFTNLSLLGEAISRIYDEITTVHLNIFYLETFEISSDCLYHHTRNSKVNQDM